MKIRKLITFTSALLFTVSMDAQDQDILLRVNDREVSADEFKWLYLKNNTADYYTDLDKYLDLYINLRLKVEAAKEAGIDKRASFKSELAGYRKQLAKNYLTDRDVRDKLIDMAYKRYTKEVHAYHILIKCPADAAPEDTLKAYNKAMNIRQRLRLGEPFESVAKGASDDPTVNINGGNLGYFTVFQTPLPFEEAVYSMNPGQLSMPVRTAAGYHIIKVQDKRDNRGRIKVAHIMKATPPGSTEANRAKARYEIDSLYNLLEKGADFSELARNNSDDMMSARNGGELPWFGTGEMIHEFSIAAFNIQRDNEYTRPVQTVYGWHIIKRLDREPVMSAEEAKKYLESRLSNSYLLSLSKKAFAEKLKEEYNYRLDNNKLEWFYSAADSGLRHGNRYRITLTVPDEVLYTFASVSCRMSDFADYIREHGSQAPAFDSVIFINSLLEQKVYNDLLAYEDSVLEDKYPEFAYLMNEFYDGIMFFEISDSLVWQKSMNDSSGLNKYYNSRKEEFRKEQTATARIYEISEDAGRRKTRRILRTIRRHHNKEDFNERLMAEAITGKDTLLKITSGTWEKGENPVLDNTRWNKGMTQKAKNNGTILVDILEVHKDRFKELNEMRGVIIQDYQEYLEAQWLEKLREKHEVSVNRDVMEKLKLEIGK
ncbi:MAG: peptidylprolyl isomerase [Bacteroidales bacterium]|nr:peptidylprolyl isomerase [Bacteroidales bacterium]